MDVKIINPFTSSAVSIFKTVANLDVKRNKMELSQGASVSQGICIILEVVDEIEGFVAFDFSEILAIKLTETLNAVDKSETARAYFDRLLEDTLLEIGNLIVGRAVTQLSTAGFDCNLSTPYLVRNVGAEVIPSSFNTITIGLSTTRGDVIVNIGLNVKK